MKHNDAIYEGDIYRADVLDHLDRNGHFDTWQQIAEQIGFTPASKTRVDDTESRWRQESRLQNLIVTARINTYAEFEGMLEDKQNTREFLTKLLAAVQSRQAVLYAVPEDVIVFVIVSHGGSYLSRALVHLHLQFNPEINEAINDILNLPAR